MSTPPRRYKTIEELTPADHDLRHRANRTGEPEPKFETDEYREARAEALRRAGLDEEEGR